MATYFNKFKNHKIHGKSATKLDRDVVLRAFYIQNKRYGEYIGYVNESNLDYYHRYNVFIHTRRY